MICPKCEKETPDNSERCVNCGVKFIRKPRKDTGVPPHKEPVKPSADDVSKTLVNSFFL